jgi:hypothetical protein
MSKTSNPAQIRLQRVAARASTTKYYVERALISYMRCVTSPRRPDNHGLSDRG